MWIASYLLITDLTSQSLLCGAMPRSSLLQDVQVPCSSCAGRAGFVRWKKRLILIYIASVTYELMTTFGNEISLGVAKSIQIPHNKHIKTSFRDMFSGQIREKIRQWSTQSPGLAQDSAAPADPAICQTPGNRWIHRFFRPRKTGENWPVLIQKNWDWSLNIGIFSWKLKLPEWGLKQELPAVLGELTFLDIELTYLMTCQAPHIRGMDCCFQHWAALTVVDRKLHITRSSQKRWGWSALRVSSVHEDIQKIDELLSSQFIHRNVHVKTFGYCTRFEG